MDSLDWENEHQQQQQHEQKILKVVDSLLDDSSILFESTSCDSLDPDQYNPLPAISRNTSLTTVCSSYHLTSSIEDHNKGEPIVRNQKDSKKNDMELELGNELIVPNTYVAGGIQLPLESRQ